MNKAEKREFVAWLNQTIKEAGCVIIAHYSGLSVTQMNEFRVKMREAGGAIKVAKNRLAKIACQGTEAEKITDLFSGQTLIAYSSDPITAPKIAVDFAKANERLVILGGAMGDTALDKAGVMALASLPSLDELRAKIVAMVSTPATRIARIVNTPAGQLAQIFRAYSQKDSAA